jgi:hypothetical protein
MDRYLGREKETKKQCNNKMVNLKQSGRLGNLCKGRNTSIILKCLLRRYVDVMARWIKQQPVELEVLCSSQH